jgi:ribosomal subunit interface protein
MHIEIYGKNIPVTEQLRCHIQRRLCFALERFATRIRRVRVSVDDLNGPRGGIDKHCRVAIMLIPSTTVELEDRNSNIYVAIDRVSDKAGRCVRRWLKRLRSVGKCTRISGALCAEQNGELKWPAAKGAML